jgi:hypothetical protein
MNILGYSVVLIIEYQINRYDLLYDVLEVTIQVITTKILLYDIRRIHKYFMHDPLAEVKI